MSDTETTLVLTWTPLVPGLVELLVRSESLSTRDAAALELRKLLAAAGMTDSQAERLLAALVTTPGDATMLERLEEAARLVDARIRVGAAR